jgi:hypothetical protein
VDVTASLGFIERRVGVKNYPDLSPIKAAATKRLDK